MFGSGREVSDDKAPIVDESEFMDMSNVQVVTLPITTEQSVLLPYTSTFTLSVFYVGHSSCLTITKYLASVFRETMFLEHSIIVSLPRGPGAEEIFSSICLPRIAQSIMLIPPQLFYKITALHSRQ
eukprot:sb/3475548/